MVKLAHVKKQRCDVSAWMWQARRKLCTLDVTNKFIFTAYIFEKFFVVGLDAAEQPLILVCLLTALMVLIRIITTIISGRNV